MVGWYKSACNEGDLGSIPGLGRSPREGKGYPLNASILAWRIPGCKESGMTERPSQPCSFSKSIKSIYIIYLFLSVLALHCCVWAFSSCCQRGLLFAVVLGFFIAMVSLVPEHRLQVLRLQQLRLSGLVAPGCVKSSQTRDPTGVPCIGEQILIHCATRAVQPCSVNLHLF